MSDCEHPNAWIHQRLAEPDLSLTDAMIAVAEWGDWTRNPLPTCPDCGEHFGVIIRRPPPR